MNAVEEGGMSEDLGVGWRLRHVRQAAGLSQRVLAKRAGITNSTISLIEADRANPSLGALKRILDAIPVGLSAFFALEREPDDAMFHAASDLVEIGKGHVSYRQVGRSMSGRKLQMLDECYKPGSDTGRIPLSHDGEEAGIIICGQIEVTVGNERRVLGPGDAYSFDSRIPHRFRCVSDVPARVVSACTPPTF
ncbi:XRE family transcriptional regulator [Sphingosinicella microcystinivorans]|nr:XRE family transcriptional regulator [Sphingosinicella microcystinivorans]